MRQFTLTDDFGRSTVFTGLRLASESTDTAAGTKPQWVDMEVYRTAAGNYVVSRTTHYRVRHLREECHRAEGYELIEPTSLDTYPCPSCNICSCEVPDDERPGWSFYREQWACRHCDKVWTPQGGCAQADRIAIDAHHSPAELIKSFETDGRYSNLARTILADVAEQDELVDAAWNTVMVP